MQTQSCPFPHLIAGLFFLSDTFLFTASYRSSTLFSCMIWEGGELFFNPQGCEKERPWKNQSEMNLFLRRRAWEEVLSWLAERERLFWTSHVFLKNAWKWVGETESKPGQGRIQWKETWSLAKKGAVLPFKSTVLMISPLQMFQVSQLSAVCRTPLFGGVLLSKKQNHDI